MKLNLSASVPALSEDRGLCTHTLDTAAGLGLTGIEIKLGDNALITENMRSWLGETLESYKFEIYAHLPYLQREVNIASPDERLGRKAAAVMLGSINFAARLGSSMVNTHLGACLGKGPHIPRAVGRLEDIAIKSDGMGVEICVENQESSCGGVLNTPEDVSTLIACKPDALLTYDPGHGNTHGFGVEEFLPVVLPRLRYLHLHDNNGQRDEHMALGRGNLNIGFLMLELEKHREELAEVIPVILELAAPDLGPSVYYLKHFSGENVVFV